MIRWKRRGPLALFIPLVLIFSAGKLFDKSQRAEAIAGLLAGIILFIHGRQLNRDEDVQEKGEHSLVGIPLELWGCVVIGMSVLQLFGVFDRLMK